MKLSLNSAKLTSLKSNALRVLAAATLAGAILTAATPAAQAQRFAIGVRVGGPAYYAPVPPVAVYGGPVYGYGYGYHPYAYGYDRRFDRDYRHFDHDGWRHDDRHFDHDGYRGGRR